MGQTHVKGGRAKNNNEQRLHVTPQVFAQGVT